MKIIFLDVDGVLNWVGTQDSIGNYIGLCPERIARFNKIIEAHPDAKIVISSTWRHSFFTKEEKHPDAYRDFEGLIALFRRRGLKGEIIGATLSKLSYIARGDEIRMWIRDCEEKIDKMVILDDDTAAMEGYACYSYGSAPQENDDLRPYHVVTTWDGDQRVLSVEEGVQLWEEGGLQDHHIEQAIKVLNGELVVPESRVRLCDVCKYPVETFGMTVCKECRE